MSMIVTGGTRGIGEAIGHEQRQPRQGQQTQRRYEDVGEKEQKRDQNQQCSSPVEREL
jgi:NAD(P)-dependent dehydrogenase (short-subunit alcohol dehydrogenase family)